MKQTKIALCNTQVEQIVKNETEGVIKKLESIASQIGAPTAPGGSGRERQQFLVNNIHIKLQTETMLNACVSAEKSGKIAMWSCIFAAIAAIAACISVVLTLCIR